MEDNQKYRNCHFDLRKVATKQVDKSKKDYEAVVEFRTLVFRFQDLSFVII